MTGVFHFIGMTLISALAMAFTGKQILDTMVKQNPEMQQVVNDPPLLAGFHPIEGLFQPRDNLMRTLQERDGRLPDIGVGHRLVRKRQGIFQRHLRAIGDCQIALCMDLLADYVTAAHNYQQTQQ